MKLAAILFASTALAAPPNYVYIQDLGKYPGYAGKANIKGTATMAFENTMVEIQFNLFGVESACATPDPTKANSCGIHIHEGTSCADATSPGGHYFNKDTITADPWGSVVYKSQLQTSVGRVKVGYGETFDVTVGRVLVVHDSTGARATCAVIKPAMKAPKTDDYVYIQDLGRYPGYAGQAGIKGTAVLDFQSHQEDVQTVSINFNLYGVESACATPGSAPNSCGIHIHEGTSCADATSPGGHYWDKDKNATDPWGKAVYKAVLSTAVGSVSVAFGQSFTDSLGRVVVVHDYAGARVTCALITQALPGHAAVKDVGTYPGYTGAVDITGSAFMDFVGSTVKINFNLAGVEATCAKPTAAGNSCGIHIHEGMSCADTTTPGGHYYNKDQFDYDPWSAIVYTAFGTKAAGTVSLEYGFDFNSTLGRALVIHDSTGARVTCAVIKSI